jgi:hypothetical protein
VGYFDRHCRSVTVNMPDNGCGVMVMQSEGSECPAYLDQRGLLTRRCRLHEHLQKQGGLRVMIVAQQ